MRCGLESLAVALGALVFLVLFPSRMQAQSPPSTLDPYLQNIRDIEGWISDMEKQRRPDPASCGVRRDQGACP